MAVTNQQILDFLTANPGMSDAQIVAAMEQYGVSPAQMAQAVGVSEGEVAARVAATVPQGQSVTLGDTIVQPNYQVIGSGEDQQIGGIENVYTYKVNENKVGGGYQQYNPDGTLQRTGTQQEVNAGQDFLKFALGGAALFGGLGGGFESLFGGGGAATGAAGTVGSTGLTMAELAQLDLALGGAGGTAGATSLANALTTGASVGTLTNLTGGSGTGLLSGGAGSTVTGMGAGTGLTAGAAGLGLSTTGAGLGAAGTGAGLTAGAGLAGTNALTGAGLGTALGGVTTGVGAAGAAAGTGLLTSAGPKVAESLVGKAVGAGLTTAAGIEQARVSKEAAQAAQKKIDDETAAAKTAAAFRPVGMTTRFGSSQFAFDPKTGQLTSAGYTLSPEAKAAQDRFVKLAESGITQAEGAQKAFEPLQTGAQSLFTLGNKYLAQSPEQVASDYLKSQMALLQPGRELELANLQNKLQQQGRGGLSVAQGGTLGATTPELQALFNARAQQEAILAANAQREGQQNVLFGSGLLNTGAQTLGQYYGGQSAAYNPYTTAMNQVQALESAGQQPLTTGINLGNLVSTAGARAGELGLRGAGQSVALATGAAATNSPLATALTGLGSSGLLTTGINNAVTAFSANQLDPSRPLGQRLEQAPLAGSLPGSGLVNDLSMSEVGPARVAAPTGPMDVNTADMARRLGINLPASYTGTTTTVNPLLPNQQYAF